MEAIESFFDFLDSNPFLIISVLLIIVGLWLILSPTIKTKNINIGNRTTRSAPNERIRTRIGQYLMIPGFLLLAANYFTLGTSSPENINFKDWKGEWEVISEEPNNKISYGESEHKYTLEIEMEGDKIKAVLYNEKGREQGGFSHLTVKKGYGYLTGKYGNNDDRRMMIELLMFPDGKSFIGRYKNRHGKDYWKIWVGTKK